MPDKPKIEPEYNHFDEMVKFLDEHKNVLSQEFRDKIIVRFSAAMQDAGNRALRTYRRVRELDKT